MKTLSCNLVRKCGQAHLQPENVWRLLFNRHDSENTLALQLMGWEMMGNLHFQLFITVQ